MYWLETYVEHGSLWLSVPHRGESHFLTALDPIFEWIYRAQPPRVRIQAELYDPRPDDHDLERVRAHFAEAMTPKVPLTYPTGTPRSSMPLTHSPWAGSRRPPPPPPPPTTPYVPATPWWTKDDELARRSWLVFPRHSEVKPKRRYNWRLRKLTTKHDLTALYYQPAPTNPLDELRRVEGASKLRAFVAQLKPRQAEIIRMRYGFSGKPPMTLKEIGQHFNLTRERIRGIEWRALQIMKVRMLRPDLQIHTYSMFDVVNKE